MGRVINPVGGFKHWILSLMYFFPRAFKYIYNPFKYTRCIHSVSAFDVFSSSCCSGIKWRPTLCLLLPGIIYGKEWKWAWHGDVMLVVESIPADQSKLFGSSIIQPSTCKTSPFSARKERFRGQCQLKVRLAEATATKESWIQEKNNQEFQSAQGSLWKWGG